MDHTTAPAAGRLRQKKCNERLHQKQVCGEPMRTVARPTGYVTLCIRCAYRKAGHCWQCGKPRENGHPQAIYCKSCGYRRVLDSNLRSQAKREAQWKAFMADPFAGKKVAR